MGNSLKSGHDAETKIFDTLSINQLAAIHFNYKSVLKDQLSNPNAENNHILNFDLKIGNYLLMHHLIHTLTAGLGVTGIRMFIGERLESMTFNYLGAKRAQFANVIVYIGMFFYCTSWLDKRSRLDINYMVNPRDFNGEIMIKIGAKLYPSKVDMQKFGQILMQRND